MDQNIKFIDEKMGGAHKVSDEALAEVSGGFADASYPSFEVGSIVNIVCMVPGAPGGAGGLVYTMNCSAEIISIDKYSSSPRDWSYEVNFLQYPNWPPEINDFGREAANKLLGTTKHFTGEQLVEHHGNR